MKADKRTPVGTVRFKRRGLQPWERTRKSWRKSERGFPEAVQVIRLFRAHRNLKALADKKDPRFLKGQLSPEGNPQGARINMLPDGRVLNKAYSLFAPHLTIHDQTTNDHWDVIYRNKGGTYSYVYTLEKLNRNRNRKYKSVDRFARVYSRLMHRVTAALKDDGDYMAAPTYTLLKTYMRIGSEMYYRAHKHKGLTTLKKGDIRIRGNVVSFDYISKNGVPCDIKMGFPPAYVSRLRRILRTKRQNEFAFTRPGSRHPLTEAQFKGAFRRYCGIGFYPHIVRSYYATAKAREFLHGRRKAEKQEVRALFTSIAEKLGHKKYVKKKHLWEDNYSVTVNSYIQPALVGRLKSMCQ